MKPFFKHSDLVIRLVPVIWRPRAGVYHLIPPPAIRALWIHANFLEERNQIFRPYPRGKLLYTVNFTWATWPVMPLSLQLIGASGAPGLLIVGEQIWLSCTLNSIVTTRLYDWVFVTLRTYKKWKVPTYLSLPLPRIRKTPSTRSLHSMRIWGRYSLELMHSSIL